MQKILTILFLFFLPFVMFSQDVDVQVNSFDHSDNVTIGSSIKITGTIRNTSSDVITEVPFNFNVKESDNNPLELNKEHIAQQISENSVPVKFMYTDFGEIAPGQEVDFSFSISVSNLSFKKGKDNIIVIWPNRIGNNPSPDNIEVHKVKVN